MKIKTNLCQCLFTKKKDDKSKNFIHIYMLLSHLLLSHAIHTYLIEYPKSKLFYQMIMYQRFIIDKSIYTCGIIYFFKIESLFYSNFALRIAVMLSYGFSMDGDMVVTSTDFRTIQIWNVQSGRGIRNFRRYSDFIDFTKFSSFDGIIKLCDVNTINMIESIQFSPDGQMIFWNVKTGERIKEIKMDDVISSRFSPDGQYIVSSSLYNIIRILDVESRKEVKQLEGHSDVINDVKYFPDDQTILSCSNDKTIRLWDIKLGNQK
ncbi:WD repeat-containing protein [Reticulomyxa filosa]|uniref:WD repeat-containing protein n=1 Tax=Reticulomyxa filosa TaxID=46433 RepID=X6LFB9_RETFI|nr:WD repeat-containing protein [Reticulomyxa filosa]|eukprot:ETN99404.1 WD repeat-containing protein [Reticulomyxa filosa]